MSGLSLDRTPFERAARSRPKNSHPLSLPVGALVDRWNRRHLMIWSDLGSALVVASVPIALWLDRLTLTQLCIVAGLQGTLMVFFNLAEVAALPRVVATAQLPQATAQNQAGYAGAAIVGPALGSWLFQRVGRAWPGRLSPMP